MRTLIKPDRNLVWSTMLCFTIVFSSCAGNKSAGKGASKPNVIVILSDDAGYEDFEIYGGKQIPTPHINSIGKQGVTFTDAYVSASVCAPSRAGLLTGRYQQRFGFEHNLSGAMAPGYTKADFGMDPAELTIADEMKANGYKTIAIGKWHLGYGESHYPLNRGFDEFYGFTAGDRSFFAYPEDRNDGHTLMNNRTPVPEKEVTYLTDMLTDKATTFIKENKEKPFFMYLSYNAVHVPMDGKKELMERFSHISDPKRRAYAAMMASLDDGVGKVLNTLKENNLDKNTIVIFLNDNGGATGNASDNGRLRGMKGSKWEGGIRVGFMMKWPGVIQTNAINDKPVISLDILPTVIAAANGKQVGSKKLDGVNLLPFVKNLSAAPHEALFWRRGVAAAVRSGNWKLIRVKSNPVLLFDLEKDVSETTNIAKEHPERVKDLLSKLESWEKGLDLPHWFSAYGDENQIIKHRMDIIGRDMERMYP